MDIEDIDKLIDQNQSIVETFPDEEVLVDEPIVEILEASLKDKAVQHSQRSKSKQTQVGGQCYTPDNNSYLNEPITSGSESYVDEVDDSFQPFSVLFCNLHAHFLLNCYITIF